MSALQKKHKKSSVHNIKSLMNTRYGANVLNQPKISHLKSG